MLRNEHHPHDDEDTKTPTRRNHTKPMEHAPPTTNIHDLLTIVKSLGRGDSCDVWRVVRHEDSQMFALKRLKRSLKWSPLLFETETTILNHLGRHPGIVQIEDVFGDADYLYILTELGETDMFGKLSRHGRYSERDARIVIRRVLETISYMHSMNVVHRDIKPENVIFCVGEDDQPKLIDFADAVIVQDEEAYTELVGTTCYLSPERLRQHTGWELKRSDIWAVGVMAYEMVTGKRCFYASHTKELFRKIQRGMWHWPRDSSIRLSDSFKNFVETLLTVPAHRRCDVEEALVHPWLDEPGSEMLSITNNNSSRIVSISRTSLQIPHFENTDSGQSTSTVNEEDEERVPPIRLGLLETE